MRVVCQQPNYFPWLGYFEQLARADAFVYLDNVQWIRQGRQHRTRVPFLSPPVDSFTKNWLTVPVHGHGHRELSFREMRIDHSRAWQRKHWGELEALYGKAPFFREQLEPLARPFLEGAGDHKFLIDLCEASVALFWKPLGLKAQVWHASDLEPEGKKSERLLHLCQTLEATEYYSALGASRYLEVPLFREANIHVRWQHFRASPVEPRRPCDYSVLDWVAHEPWEKIRGALGASRGSIPESASLGEGTVEGVVSLMQGSVN